MKGKFSISVQFKLIQYTILLLLLLLLNCCPIEYPHWCSNTMLYTGCFTICGHYCRRWFPRSLWSKKFVLTCVRFWTVTELWVFFISHTRPRVNRVLRNQLAGDLLNLAAYRLCCKHYFCHLTRPPSYRQYSFRISTLGRYLRNAGKVEWVGIRLASVYCMTQLLLLRVQKPLSLTLQWLCRLLLFRTVRR